MAIGSLKSLSTRVEKVSARNGDPDTFPTEIYLVGVDPVTMARREPVLIWKAKESSY